MRRGWFIGLSIALDMLFVNLGIVASFYLRFGGMLPDFNFEPYLSLAPVITVIYLGCGYIYGLYEPERTEHPWAVMRAVVSSVTLGTALTSALLFFAGPGFFSFSRLVILISWFVVGLALTLWRLVFLKSTSIVWPEQRIVLVGTDKLALELAAELAARARWGYRVAGLISTDTDVGEATEISTQFPLLGSVDDIGRIVRDQRADRVIIVSPVALRELIEHLTLADEVDVRVDVVPELYEIFIGTVDSLVADIPLMEITRTGVPRWYASAKRVVDVVGALFLLVLLSPVLILAAVAIMLTMGWPIFYSQDRTGRDMRTFRLHKFRTMVQGAERESGPVLATDDDPRITPLGK
ncbi:MAG: sugar transferase, partial [Actinomycetota bacterium]|nr:sugar transferase [Actinomycetota bacterium]